MLTLCLCTSITNMGFKNENGIDIKDVWASEGIQSYLGMTIAGFPNAFMIYSPHGEFPHTQLPSLNQVARMYTY